MKVTILGCGASSGVPNMGCDCAVCTSDDPKNDRQRVSILIDIDDTRILVDTSPDLRRQSLANNISTVDAILYTHAHSDHAHGIDDMKRFKMIAGEAINAYGDKATMDELKLRFSYIFEPNLPEYKQFGSFMVANEIEAGKAFKVNNIEIIPFRQCHGEIDKTLGFRIGNFAYSTDVISFPDESWEILEGIDTWIVDCMFYNPPATPKHAHLDLTLEWIDKIKPRLSILTHMNHSFDYDTLKGELPDGVVPAYDNMVVNL